ncbi:MAG: cbb3-type cytochrome c oxidase subunit I [Planctomycetes bacterium]|nr:cbb3-type cytochrome c oxidase subunit I [Planctomycetota bacterium]
MTTHAPAHEIPTVEGRREPDYLRVTKGFMSWVTTLDHKRIGLMYLFGVTLAFIVGGIFAMLLRAHLWNPGPDGQMFSPQDYNQLFTLHGAFMVFAFIIPAIPGSIANFALPLLIGAPDVALPKLNLASFYLWLFGTVLLSYSAITNGLDTGWTFYTPWSLKSQTAVLSAGLGVFVIGFSSIFTGLNFLVTMHKMRARGMGWFQMPLFCWAIYASSVLQVLATPVLGITVALLAFEHIYHIGVFDPAEGGDPVLFQHFFWFYSHPAVYIMILPGMGIISEVVSTHSRRPLFGYKLLAFSSIAIAVISFLVWGHHMYTSGQSEFAMQAFSFLTVLVAIPTAIKMWSWVATIWGGSIALTAPMLYAIAFLVIFTIGGLTGVYLAALAIDIHLHDTYFVVAHFHAVMMGSTAIAFFAGVHHWWPKMFGRMYNEKLASIAAIVILTGFMVTFLPQFEMGSQGMPRRYATYSEQWVGYHRASTVGAMILGAGFALMVGYLLHSLIAGRKAKPNEWGGVTLDWKCPTPPNLYNFDDEPIAGKLYDYGPTLKR